MSDTATTPLFPCFERYAAERRLLEIAKGSMAAKLPRILGQGKTRAEGLDLPPAPIERRQELISLPLDGTIPPEVQKEIASVRRFIEAEQEALRRSEGVRRFATSVLKELKVAAGFKDNQFYAGRLVLVSDKSGMNWSWSLTPYYPIVSKIPPDLTYVVMAHSTAERILEDTTLSVDSFHQRLALAWAMARQFSSSDDVLITDVARMYKVAGQDDRFWSTPARRNFSDIPEGVFIANLINWRRSRPSGGDSFEFVPATLNQAHGPKSKAFFMPVNPEGTQVRPVIYLRRIEAKST